MLLPRSRDRPAPKGVALLQGMRPDRLLQSDLGKSGCSDADYADGISSGARDLWILALDERLKVRQNCGIANAPEDTDDHREMSAVFERLTQQGLGSSTGSGEQYARDRPLILVVGREGVNERAPDSRLPGYVPQRARGKEPNCRPYVHDPVLQKPKA